MELQKRKRPANRWDDKNTIRKVEFASGECNVEMAPAEDFFETYLAQKLTNFVSKKTKNFHAIHHACIDDKGLHIPDVSFWTKNENGRPEKPVVVIEIENNTQKSNAINKCKSAIINHNILEAFVYNTDDKLWKKFATIFNESTEKNKLYFGNISYSEILQLDLNNLI